MTGYTGRSHRSGISEGHGPGQPTMEQATCVVSWVAEVGCCG